MIIKLPKIKVPNLSQPLQTTDSIQWQSFIEWNLANNPYSENWNLAKTTIELTEDDEIIFWHDGKRESSVFMGDKWFINAECASHPLGEMQVLMKVAKGKVLAKCLHIHSDYVQEKSNFGPYSAAFMRVARL